MPLLLPLAVTTALRWTSGGSLEANEREPDHRLARSCPSSCLACLYVYDSQHSSNADGLFDRRSMARTLAIQEWDDASDTSYKYKALNRSGFFGVNAFNLAAMMLLRLQKSSCRTKHPSTADLFVVTMPESSLKHNGDECDGDSEVIRLLRAEVGVDRAGVSYMERHRGSDHILISSRSAWSFDICGEMFNTSSPLGLATRITLDGGPLVRWDAADSFPYHAGLYLTVPSPAAVLKPGYQPPSNASSRRGVVVFAGTKNHIIDRNLAMTLRQRLMEACSIRSECTDGEQFVALSALSQSSDLSIRATALELYQRAEFCLMPSVSDALAMGCIPVFFHTAAVAIWPAHWGSWIRSASVFFPLQDVLNNGSKLFDQLALIPMKQRDNMRAAARSSFGHSLVYSPTDADTQGMGDAWDVALKVAHDYALASKHAAEINGTVYNPSGLQGSIEPPSELADWLARCCWWGGGAVIQT